MSRGQDWKVETCPGNHRVLHTSRLPNATVCQLRFRVSFKFPPNPHKTSRSLLGFIPIFAFSFQTVSTKQHRQTCAFRVLIIPAALPPGNSISSRLCSLLAKYLRLGIMATLSETKTIDPQQNCLLNKIPVELLVRITYFISTEDLGNVRLTCRALERSLFNFFSHEFFRKKQFMVSTFSLQALLDIAKHPAFSRCLKHVVISTDRYLRRSTHHVQPQVRQAFNEVCTDHESLWATGLLRDFLTEAFKNLPNLETVDIRDFNSRTRNRDGRSLGTAYWSSYGAPSLFRQFSARPTQDSRSPEEQLYRSQLFSAVVASLAAAEARPNSIEVIPRSTGLVDSAFFIPARMEPSITQVLSGLTKLHLVMEAPYYSQLDMPMAKKFLLLTPQVTWLRLNFFGSPYNGPINTSEQLPAAFLSWISGTNDDGTPLQNQFPSFHLETLELGNFSIRPAHLTRVTTRFASTLRVLGLRRITLDGRRDNADDKINIWRKIFTEQLPRVPGLDLRKIQLALLRQDHETVVLIDPLTGNQAEERTYTGEMAKVIQKVGAEITPLWPKPSEVVVPDGKSYSYIFYPFSFFQLPKGGRS